MMTFEGDPMDNDTAMLLAFLNSTDTDDADRFASDESLRAWFEAHDVCDVEVHGGDARRARHARAALRDYVASLHGNKPDDRTIPLLNDVARKSGLVLQFEPGAGLSLQSSAPGLDGFFADLLAALHEMSRSGALRRLKLCKACAWAFVDQSKNRSRVWCDMAACGSQSKVRAFRERQRRVKR